MTPHAKRTLQIAVALAGLSASPAFAHVVANPNSGTAGGALTTVFRVSHGCGGSATVSLRMKIPDGVAAVKPQAKPGWTVTVTKRKLDKPVQGGHGATITEEADEIVWRGGPLADDLFDTFSVMMRLPDAAGATLYFPTVQECETGKNAWTNIPGPGQAWGDVNTPAPFIRVQGKPGEAANAMPSPLKAGALAITQPFVRATPAGAQVAGAYMRITNTGKEPDRLVGGSLERAKRFELHDMTMVDNVMRMRPVPNGLEIKPGETVELKPGGYHIMGLELQGGYTQGQTVKGTLRFERAGTIAVEYAVGAIGGGAPGGAMPGQDAHEHKH